MLGIYGGAYLDVRKQTGMNTVTLGFGKYKRGGRDPSCPPARKDSLSVDCYRYRKAVLVLKQRIRLDSVQTTMYCMAGKRHWPVAALGSKVKRRRQRGKTLFNESLL